MKSDTQAITINVSQKQLFDFIADPANLPRWATSLCKSVRPDGREWIMETDMGDISLKCVSDAELGIVDFHISPPFPVKITLNTRVVSNGSSSEFIFTQFQIPFTPESVFEKQKQKLSQHLLVLKQHIESM